MIRIRSDRELAEWIEAGRGVIYNDFSPSLGTPRENRLHRASCQHLQRANVQVDKYASLDEADATAWLERQRGPEDIAWFRCGSCFASSPTRTQSEIGAARRSGSNDWAVVKSALTVTARLPRTIGYRADKPLPTWMIDAKAAIRSAVSTLPLDGRVLSATMTGPVPPGADLENLLLYNIGISSAALRHGVRLRRSLDVGPGVVLEYTATDSSTAAGETFTPAFEFTTVLRPGDFASPRTLWLALRPAAISAGAAQAMSGDVTLRVGVSGWRTAVTVDAIKAWVDAACSAMHTYAGGDLDNAVARVVKETGADVEHVRGLATNPNGAPLGPYPFLAPWRSIARLHPADDRLEAVEIAVADRDADMRIRVELNHRLSPPASPGAARARCDAADSWR